MFDRIKSLLSPIRLSEVPILAATNPKSEQLEIAAATLGRYKHTINTLIDVVGDIPARDLNPKQLAEWQAVIAQRVNNITQNMHASTARAIFGRLIEFGILRENPAEFVRFVPEPPLSPKAVSEENYLRMRAVADVRDRAIVDVLWETGCRRGGLCSMRLNSLEFWEEKGKLRVAIQVIEKGENPRTVYGKKKASESLMRWIGARPKVSIKALWIGQRGESLTPNGVTQMMIRLKELAEISEEEPANSHAFRHAFCIRKLDEGYDLALVSAWMGHSSPAFTAARYAVRSEAQLRKAYFRKASKER